MSPSAAAVEVFENGDSPLADGVVLRVTARAPRGASIGRGREVSIRDRARLGIGKQEVTLLLVARRGTVMLVFKRSAWAFFGGSISYVEVPAEAIPRLQQWVNEAQAIIASGEGGR